MAENALGIDVGTSGIRAVVLSPDDSVLAEAAIKFGLDAKDPGHWREVLEAVLRDVLGKADPQDIAAVSVDGTSGTILATDREGTPLCPPIMYNEAVEDPTALAQLAAHDLAHLASGATGRACRAAMAGRDARVVHQADWISGQLSGQFDLSDENNALKTGFDPETQCWSDHLATLGVDPSALPEVHPAGTAIADCSAKFARSLGLLPGTRIVAGTTDGCASFLATGADRAGDGVTALGSTITLKVLSKSRIENADYGIYSHRVLGNWLAGGASNSGGAVLTPLFTPEQIVHLSNQATAEPPTEFDYYPLPRPGERFPENDPEKEPRMSPRPQDDATFLKALFEGMANVEAAGYRKLAELGGPEVTRLFTVGGGAQNPLWTAIRAMRIGVRPVAVGSADAAHGTARLARIGAGL